MKFDKFMEHCYKIMCVVVAFVVVAGCVASCTRPIKAKAWVELIFDYPDEFWNIAGGEPAKNYWNAWENKRELIKSNVSAAMQGEGHHRQEAQDIVSLQDIYMYWWLDFYDKYENDTSNFPESVEFSASGFNGVYTSRLDNLKHLATSQYITGDGVFVSSDEFNVKCSHVSYGYGGRFVAESSPSSGGYSFNTLYDPYNRSVAWTISDTGSYFTSSGSYSQSNNTTQGRYAAFNGSADYVLPSNLLSNYSSNSSLNFGGYGSSISCPSTNIDTLTPWDYYNRTLLPYIYNNFDIDDIDNYLIFPSGYGSDPFEPDYINPNVNFSGVGVGGAIPIVIGAGAVLNIMGNDINVFAPVKGQINIDGIQLQFPVDNNNKVYIDGDSFDIPTPELSFDDHSLEILENTKFLLDGIQFLINSDGSLTVDNTTYNLPIGQPETLATGDNYLVYKYQIPTMEKINIVDAELEPVDLSPFSDGINFLWGSVARFYTDTGLMGAVLTCLGLSAVGFFVAKIGGH